MKTMLLHVCCGPCSTHVIDKLKTQYNLTLFFFNPNIEPIEEYKQRLKTVKEYSKNNNISLIIGDYQNKEWHSDVKGYEGYKEGGERCTICFDFRLEETAKKAKELNSDLFTTTLTVSPYKNKDIINNIGKQLEKKYNVEFLEENFKKENGYLHSIELSKKHNLYRQHYCGCLFAK